MSLGIRQDTIDHIKATLHLLEIDLKEGKILNRATIDTGRYYTIKLKNRHIKVHHVIAIAGGLNIKAGDEVNHKNGNKKDNRLENLEISSHSENIKHAYDTKLLVAKRGTELSWTKINEEQAREIKLLLKKGLTVPEISKITGVSIHTIYHIKHGKTWAHIRD